MKFATLRNGNRDGHLIVVSRDLTRAASAKNIVPTLLDALEHWDQVAPQLEILSTSLNNNTAPNSFAFDQRACAAPLPRANQWLDASTYGAHGKLMKASLKLERQPHADFPLLLQGMPSDFLGPFDDEPLPSDDVDIDFECEIGVITGAVPARPTLAQAGASVRLLVMLNDWTLRGVVPKEIASGFGFMRAKAPVAFAAVAITPDEVGDAWRDFRLHLRAKIRYNGKPWGDVSAAGMDYGFDQLIAEVATNRRVLPGTIIGSGSISEGDPARVGASNVAEVRGYEIITTGAASSPYAHFGNVVRMETLDAQGASLFGVIEQRVVKSP